MNRLAYWIAFLLTLVIPLLGYSGYTIFLLFHYNLLDKQVRLQMIEWTILEVNDQKFRPTAHYTFKENGVWYQGNDEWSDYSLNRWAANEKLKLLRQRVRTVWIRQSDPSFSKLEKAFPLKQTLSVPALWGLFLYFIFLGRYMIGFSQPT